MVAAEAARGGLEVARKAPGRLAGVESGKRVPRWRLVHELLWDAADVYAAAAEGGRPSERTGGVAGRGGGVLTCRRDPTSCPAGSA